MARGDRGRADRRDLLDTRTLWQPTPWDRRYGAVSRWRAHHNGHADDLQFLARTPEPALRAITNGGQTAGRTKAQAVIEVAATLASVGVVSARDFEDRQQVAKHAYLSVKGCGPVTWAYFRMLLGHDDVKPDTWVIRFVQDVLPEVHTAAEASRLVQAVANLMDVSARNLDHAIWRYRRIQPD